MEKCNIQGFKNGILDNNNYEYDYHFDSILMKQPNQIK